MKNKRAKCKKSIAVLLAAVMVVLLMPWSSFAGENARAATGIGSAGLEDSKAGNAVRRYGDTGLRQCRKQINAEYKSERKDGKYRSEWI